GPPDHARAGADPYALRSRPTPPGRRLHDYMSTSWLCGWRKTVIVEYIRYRVPADMRDEFEAAYARAAVSLGAAPQCVEYELTQCTEDEQSYILRIVWTSEEGHLTGFRKSANFTAFFEQIRPYVDHIEEMRHYRRTAV